MRSMTAAEWREKALELSKGDLLDTPIQCPSCGLVSTPRDFLEAGADPNLATQRCIGRVTGGPNVARWGKGQPCDWTAGGLFGTCDRGVIVTHPDGKEVEVFDFAEARP